MRVLSSILLCATYIITVAADCGRRSEPRSGPRSEPRSDILAGYVPGVSGIPPIDPDDCSTSVLNKYSELSNTIECARTCRVGEPPKTCYHEFVIERYPINGRACDLCASNFTNQICPNCQCVIANGVDRMALTVNRMLPGPTIQICLGDKLVIDVVNKVKEIDLTIHWHGIFQQNDQYFDGVPFLTQCPIHAENKFRYHFRPQNSGTHFWHAHTGVQKLDGVTGTLVVREPAEKEPNAHLYDFDLVNHVIHISDWMNESGDERFPGRRTGVTGQFPDGVLINGKGQLSNTRGVLSPGAVDVITVDAKSRYRFRLINSFCTVCAAQLTIEGHELTVIAADGVAVQPMVVNSIITLPAERYDFVINTNQAPGAYWIQLRALGDCEADEIQSLAILQYTNGPSRPSRPPPSYRGGLNPGAKLNSISTDCNNPAPNEICVTQLQSAVPLPPVLLKPKPDFQFYLPISLHAYSANEIFRPGTYKDFLSPAPGVQVATMIDGIAYEVPPSPPTSQLEDLPPSQFCDSQNLPQECKGKCLCTHVIKIPLGAVAEFILIDQFGVPDIYHPFHLHGYAFSVISMGTPLGPVTNNSNILTVDFLKQLQMDNQIRKNLKNPPAKDVIAVPNNGYVIFRFHATNPGYWMLHCHFVYHQLAGMALVVQVGEQSDLPPVPKDFPKCGHYLPSIKTI